MWAWRSYIIVLILHVADFLVSLRLSFDDWSVNFLLLLSLGVGCHESYDHDDATGKEKVAAKEKKIGDTWMKKSDTSYG
jgi:hypothetical protein